MTPLHLWLDSTWLHWLAPLAALVDHAALGWAPLMLACFADTSPAELDRPDASPAPSRRTPQAVARRAGITTHRRYLDCLARCSKLLVGIDDDPANTLHRVLEQVRRAARLCRAYICLNARDDAGRLCLQLAHEACAEGVSPDLGHPELEAFPYDPTFSRWKTEFEADRTIAGPVCQMPPQEQEPLRRHGVASLLAIPLRGRDGWTGFIGFDDTRAERHWGRDELRLLQAVCTLINAYLDRQAAEAALRQSNARYARTARGANDGLWDWDLRTDQVYYSSRWIEQLGYETDEIPPTPSGWLDLVYPNDRPQLEADLALHLADRTGHFQNEHRIRHRDGEYRWVLCRGVAEKDEAGEPVRLAGSLSDISVQKSVETDLRHQSLHDRLTGLPNRSLLHDRLEQAIARRKRMPSYHYALMFLDFDRFKVINDSLGHGAGDQLLVQISQRMQLHLRSTDTIAHLGRTHTPARMGGDEFVILLDSLSQEADLSIIAQRLQQRLSSPYQIAGQITASIGIVTGDADYKHPDEVLRDADTAMYEAKRSGKACHVHFHRKMHEVAVARMQMENDLRKALPNDELRVLYQPIVNLETGRLAGFEALLRWHHPVDGMVSPVDFIPVAEETGLIIPIGRYVLSESLKRLASWRRDHTGRQPLFMSVNLSRQQLLDPHLVADVRAALKQARVEATQVKLEVTESMIMDDAERMLPVLNHLRKLGCQLSMDDFGTGHSSLSCLNRFPVDVLKIDRAFITNMGLNVEYAAITQAVVTLAHNLGMTVVAEGIENSGQVAQLQAMECDLGQGYYFARPLSADDATESVRRPQLRSPAA